MSQEIKITITLPAGAVSAMGGEEAALGMGPPPMSLEELRRGTEVAADAAAEAPRPFEQPVSLTALEPPAPMALEELQAAGGQEGQGPSEPEPSEPPGPPLTMGPEDGPRL